MTFARNPGRFVGLLYLLASIPGFFALLYVPSKLFVHGNPTATADNIIRTAIRSSWRDGPTIRGCWGQRRCFLRYLL